MEMAVSDNRDDCFFVARLIFGHSEIRIKEIKKYIDKSVIALSHSFF
jgi:hypothetical protein